MIRSLVLVADGGRPLQALEGAVSSAAARGCLQIAIDIGALARFDVSEVRELIRLQRVARERGASVAIHAASDDRRRTLTAMGLDRVFAIVA